MRKKQADYQRIERKADRLLFKRTPVELLASRAHVVEVRAKLAQDSARRPQDKQALELAHRLAASVRFIIKDAVVPASDELINSMLARAEAIVTPWLFLFENSRKKETR